VPLAVQIEKITVRHKMRAIAKLINGLKHPLFGVVCDRRHTDNSRGLVQVQLSLARLTGSPAIVFITSREKKSGGDSEARWDAFQD
jgi:hypothetical protein